MAKKHKKKTLFRILLSALAIGSIFLASNSKENCCKDKDNDEHKESSMDNEYDQCNA
ncbi:hypothetical protein [Clostridium botulinum]|uniref:Lipoprotein n=1 Tax=Clostridium botulinum (strain Langeland / NCTC 10281 / Type F) TaxID=441772 RepID=A7GCX1_CLOBL|nr:hypothetical protein [Clostridium botulinum]ABS42773.1 hypothetical protein CLI_1366 [Clostridium botulinum F str. Langeland]ADF99085.1 hypothetical protein CBF_1340 [Clostridium botulinum F str. 230613]KKM43358.1 hypothetical protein VT72_06850 [Clostridium botulinum]MBY6791126.1 hypothetical protein [Clostridium botulinum]MBY6936357.1 hypothetical protein [Clostridium botulinum]